MLTILCGDALAKLHELPDESVQCCVSSPPYWGLRDYGTATWEGGDAGCDHLGRSQTSDASTLGEWKNGGGQRYKEGTGGMPFAHTCGKCGAKRIDAQLGLEKTPKEYVAKMVAVFREVRRVLKNDGTLWLNFGDSYCSTAPGTMGDKLNQRGIVAGVSDRRAEASRKARPNTPSGLKPKDLVGIPWEIAKALRNPFYSGRVTVERERVWLAAILDAEGCICGFDHDRADGNGHRSGVHITITNTSKAMLDEAARIWPASRSEHEKHYGGHLGNKPSWRWIAHGIDNKMAFLREIYPYLIVKRKQAVAAYSLLLLMMDAKRLGHSAQKGTTMEKRAVLTQLLSDLNQQLNPVMPDWLTEPPTLYSDGWWLRQDIIWSKPNPMPESVTDRCTKAHEYLFLLSKSQRYFYDAAAIAEPVSGAMLSQIEQGYNGTSTKDYNGAGVQDPSSVKARIIARARLKGNARTFRGGGAYTQSRSFDNSADVPRESHGNTPNHNLTRNKRSVWTVTTQPYAEAHFATFPPDLIKPCILAGSRPGDVILDPFAGSGTTGQVALELGRKAILIELNPKYVALIERRTHVTPGFALG